MAAKTWEEDYRFAAIQASLGQIGDRQPEDLFDLRQSFCLPVGVKPQVGWTPGIFYVIALVLGFAFLGGGVFVVTLAENDKGDLNPLLAIAAFCCSMSGIAMFFVPVMADRLLVSWLIGDRGQKLWERANSTRLMTAEVTHGDTTNMKLSISGDDFGLILPDEANHRVLIEGIGARYQIRAADVEKVAPYLFMNNQGVEVIFWIDDVRLHLAVARTSLMVEFLRQAPILFFLKGLIKNRLYDRFSQVLEPAGTTVEKPTPH